MDEQQQLNELQQKMADTMSQMELKAAELQQKLNKKMELSKSNAEMGIKRVALEYKVVEFEVDLPYPPDFDPYPESDDDEDDQQGRPMGRPHGVDSPFGRQPPQTQEAQEEARKERIRERMKEARKVMKNIKLEALRQCRVFETTKLKELGEDGWTLQSIDQLQFPDLGVYVGDKLLKNESYTNLYYFSRPL
jgi:hypothetical protein